MLKYSVEFMGRLTRVSERKGKAKGRASMEAGCAVHMPVPVVAERVLLSKGNRGEW